MCFDAESLQEEEFNLFILCLKLSLKDERYKELLKPALEDVYLLHKKEIDVFGVKDKEFFNVTWFLVRHFDEEPSLLLEHYSPSQLLTNEFLEKILELLKTY